MQPAELGEMRRNQPHKPRMTENHQNHGVASVPMLEANMDGGGKMDTKMIDLNSNPQRMHGQTSNNQVDSTPISNFSIFLWYRIPFGCSSFDWVFCLKYEH